MKKNCLAALLLGGFACFVLWVTYNAGYNAAKVKGDLALVALEKAHAEARAKQWADYATKESEARFNLYEEALRVNELEAELLNAKNTLANERRGFAKRIADATNNNDCILGPDVVRLYNEALYGPAWANALPRRDSAPCSTVLEDGAGCPAAPDAGLLQQPVTLKDLLAHARDYGQWARETHAIALGWNRLQESQ